MWKLDRAFRTVVDGATTVQTLRAHGCGIRSLREPWIDTTTAIGEAMYHVTLAWAQLEKKQLTERVRAGMERARSTRCFSYVEGFCNTWRLHSSLGCLSPAEFERRRATEAAA